MGQSWNLKSALLSALCLGALVACLASGCAAVPEQQKDIVPEQQVKSTRNVFPDGHFDFFPGEDTIPIMSWYCIPPEFSSEETYKELRDCGFNLSFAITNKDEDALKALDYAAAAGIRMLTYACGISADPAAYAAKVKDHPGLGGYHLIRDEPHSSLIPKLKARNDALRKADPEHFTYLNLLPVGATDSFMPYEQYVRYCFTEVDTAFLSYDFYGIAGGMVRDGYLKNLEIISRIAREMNKPFWAFALATAHWGYSVPTVAHLKLQMYSNLAYGAQGLQYYTYWTPLDSDAYREGPILRNGKRTSVYDMVKETNEELQKRNFVFMRSKVRLVRNTAAQAYSGTTQLDVEKDLPPVVRKLDTHGCGAIVSVLEKGDKTYLVIVNINPSKPFDLDMEFAGNDVVRIRKDGAAVPASEYSGHYILGPGECEVFSLFNNAPVE